MSINDVVAQCEERFRQCRSEEEAREFVEALELKVAELKELTRGFGFHPLEGTKAGLIRSLVAHTVGLRLAREAIRAA